MRSAVSISLLLSVFFIGGQAIAQSSDGSYGAFVPALDCAVLAGLAGQSEQEVSRLSAFGASGLIAHVEMYLNQTSRDDLIKSFRSSFGALSDTVADMNESFIAGVIFAGVIQTTSQRIDREPEVQLEMNSFGDVPAAQRKAGERLYRERNCAFIGR